VTLCGVSTSATAHAAATLRADEEAFRALVEASWDRLVRLARAVAGDAEAEDVVQEALLVAWRKLPHLRDGSKFPAWAARIVYRRAVRRAKATRCLASVEAVAEPGFSPDPAARIDVWRTLLRLAPRQRAVLHLTVVEGMTDAEIGAALGIAPASVRTHRRRARQRVAAILSGGET
jgi:RNA polymerase sigma-70 factor (ECF subfamily)